MPMTQSLLLQRKTTGRVQAAKGDVTGCLVENPVLINQFQSELFANVHGVIDGWPPQHSNRQTERKVRGALLNDDRCGWG